MQRCIVDTDGDGRCAGISGWAARCRHPWRWRRGDGAGLRPATVPASACGTPRLLTRNFHVPIQHDRHAGESQKAAASPPERAEYRWHRPRPATSSTAGTAGPGAARPAVVGAAAWPRRQQEVAAVVPATATATDASPSADAVPSENCRTACQPSRPQVCHQVRRRPRPVPPVGPGVTAAEGAAQLTAQAQHIAVSKTAVRFGAITRS